MTTVALFNLDHLTIPWEVQIQNWNLRRNLLSCQSLHYPSRHLRIVDENLHVQTGLTRYLLNRTNAYQPTSNLPLSDSSAGMKLASTLSLRSDSKAETKPPTLQILLLSHYNHVNMKDFLRLNCYAFQILVSRLCPRGLMNRCCLMIFWISQLSFLLLL